MAGDYIGAAEFYLEVTRGNVDGQAMVGVVAQNDAITTSFTDMWAGGGQLVYPTSAESLEIVSGSANDTSAGTGARTVVVNSLDASYNEQSQTVTLNGTTPVALTGTHFRTNRMFAATAGTVSQNGVAAGDITLRVASAGATRGVIKAGKTGAMSSHYTVPLGKTAVFLQSSGFAVKNEDITVRTRFQIGGAGIFFIGGEANLYQGNYIFPFLAGLVLPEKSEFMFEVKSTNTPVSGTTIAEFILKDN